MQQLGLFLAALAVGVSAETVQVRELPMRARARARVAAEEGMTISCPLHWPQLEYVVGDGVYVEKDTVIVVFGTEPIEHALQEQRRRHVEVKGSLKKTLTSLRNRDLDLRDAMAELIDDRDVLQTQLQRLQALPDPDDIAIAKGRLHVAQLEFDAAERDCETARNRFDRGMISPAELDGFERAFREHEARLTYRKEMLDVASRPAKPTQLRRIELLIANVALEIEKLENQIAESEKLADIEKRGATSRVEMIEQRIDELEADLEKTEVKAPIAGYVAYLPLFRKHRARTGEKMWKNLAFLRIPNQETLVLRAVIPETIRRYFDEGDEVAVTTTVRPDEQLSGTIKTFGAMPHDRGEKEQESWNRDADSGIMVYDVTIELDAIPDWLRVGMTADTEIAASRPVDGPSVPASYIRTRDGEFYLAIDGVYQKVEGQLVEGYFVLNDRELEGATVTWAGEFPDRARGDSGDEGPAGGHLRLSGELVPADTEKVAVERIHGWQKVAWLIPEDTQVEKNTIVAKLDTADTDEEVKERKTELKRAISRRESEEEQLKRRTRENAFAVAKAENALELTRMTLRELIDNEETASVLGARLSRDLAALRLEYLSRRLKRVEAMSRTALSPSEVERLRRDRTRAELQLEAATLKVGLQERGPDEARVARAELDVLERELSVATLKKKLETDEARYNYGLRRAEREERRRKEYLAQIKERREHLQIRAPRAGLVRYEKIWSTGVWTKVDVGSMAGHRTVLMQIADVSRMYIELEVPERFFTQVATGMRVGVRIPSLTEAVLEGTVSEIEFLFRRKRRKDTQRGLYSSHEELGETVSKVRIEVDEQHGVKLKPGAIADVLFPFASHEG